MVGSMCNVVYWIIVIHSMCWNDRTWHTSVVLHHNVPSFVKEATSRWYCRSAIPCWCRYLVPSPKHTKKCSCRRRILSAEILASNKSAFTRWKHFLGRLRVVPHFSSGIVERAKRERAWRSPHSRKGDTRRGERKKIFLSTIFLENLFSVLLLLANRVPRQWSGYENRF